MTTLLQFINGKVGPVRPVGLYRPKIGPIVSRAGPNISHQKIGPDQARPGHIAFERNRPRPNWAK